MEGGRGGLEPAVGSGCLAGRGARLGPPTALLHIQRSCGAASVKKQDGEAASGRHFLDGLEITTSVVWEKYFPDRV